jgi:hypothetical protein
MLVVSRWDNRLRLKELLMAANIQTFTKTITTVHTTEVLAVAESTTDDIKAFLVGSGYRYSTASESVERNDVVGYMSKPGAYLIVRSGDFIVRLDGQIREPVNADQLAERFIN